MQSLINKAVTFFASHWKPVLGVFGGIAASIGSFFFGRNYEKKRCEKVLKKLQEVVRKHEAEILALKNEAKQTRKTRKRIAQLELEVDAYRALILELEQKKAQL